MEARYKYEMAYFFPVYEPGDTTRYTVMLAGGRAEGELQREVFVAIGGAQTIQGGYYLGTSQLGHVFRTLKPAKLIEYERNHILGYFQGHLPEGMNKWTITVAVIFGAVACFGDIWDPRQAGLPGLLYHRKWEEAAEVIAEFSYE